MKITKFSIAILGLGMAVAPVAVLAQAPAAAATATSTISVDQQPTKEQLAKLFEVMRLREQMQTVLKQMPAMIQQQMKAQMADMVSKLPGAKQLTPEQQATVDKMMGKYMQKALEIYPVSEMLEDMGSIYQRHLSRTDVDAFIAFYQSPAGEHLLDAQPAIMQEYMPLVMSHVQGRSKELNEELIKDMAEMAKSMAPTGTTPSGK